MSVAVRRDRPMRVAQFVEWVETTPPEERWELLDGEPVMMAPPSERHQMIVANLLSILRNPARKAGCRALPGIGLVNEANDSFAPIPDVFVRGGPLGPSGYTNDPVLVAEILSPSTMDIDRGRKSTFYKSIPTLMQYLVIFQDEARVEAWTRQGEMWAFQAFARKGVIEVPHPSAKIALSRLYAGFAF